MKNAIMAIRETTVLSSQAASGLNTSSAHKQTGRSNMQSQTASPDHDKYKKQIEKLTKERDRAISDNERLEKEAVANKYTV